MIVVNILILIVLVLIALLLVAHLWTRKTASTAEKMVPQAGEIVPVSVIGPPVKPVPRWC